MESRKFTLWYVKVRLMKRRKKHGEGPVNFWARWRRDRSPEHMKFMPAVIILRPWVRLHKVQYPRHEKLKRLSEEAKRHWQSWVQVRREYPSDPDGLFGKMVVSNSRKRRFGLRGYNKLRP